MPTTAKSVVLFILLLFHSRSVFGLSLSINVIPDPDFFLIVESDLHFS
jgi:hypothetical protein